jgi:hypothetical protein
MQLEGLIPDRFTFVPVLNACASLRALEMADKLINRSLKADVFVGSSLVDMYVKCGEYGRCLESVQQAPISQCGLLDRYDIGTCEMWTRPECTGSILTNTTGMCAARYGHFRPGAECMC